MRQTYLMLAFMLLVVVSAHFQIKTRVNDEAQRSFQSAPLIMLVNPETNGFYIDEDNGDVTDQADDAPLESEFVAADH